MSQEQISKENKKIYEEVAQRIMENEDNLNNCTKHDFSIDLNPDRVLGKRWKCTRCGGEVGAVNKRWYEKGLKHGGLDT